MPSSSVASEGEKIPKSSFEIYRTEGDSLFRNGDYIKAIEGYTQALELAEGDRHCLVKRSQCYLHNGDIEKALEDSENSLKEDPKYYKGIFQKAEVLYFMADFENALVYYHRGNKLRPELQLFRLGIQKTEEAINNAVGDCNIPRDPAIVHLKSNGDLTHFYEKENNQKSKKDAKKTRQPEPTKKERKSKGVANDKTVKELLGELYADREYLEKILNEEESYRRKTENSDKIRSLAIDGLNYLESRSDFWQQQQPMYSRKHQRAVALQGASSSSSSDDKQPLKYVLNNLDQICEKQMNEDHDGALKQSQRVLKRVEGWTEENLPNKSEVIANLYSMIGNCYLEKSKFEKALEFHNKDLELGKAKEIDEAVSRAMDNLGRVHAKRGEYQKAIDIWEEKLPLGKTALESTWLNHEIGRCYLELGNYEKAREMGEASLSFAAEITDDSWQLNANVLVAQSEVKLGQHQSAIDSFERALEYAKVMDNHNAKIAIERAIDEVNQKMIESMKEEEKEGEEGNNEEGHKEDDPDNKDEGSPKRSPKEHEEENSPKEDDPQPSAKESPKDAEPSKEEEPAASDDIQEDIQEENGDDKPK